MDKLSGKPRYFCKVSRIKNVKAMSDESRALFEINKKLQHTRLVGTVPTICAYGNYQGYEYQITDFASLLPSSDNLLRNSLRALYFLFKSKKIGRFILRNLLKLWLKRHDKIMFDALSWLEQFHKIMSERSLTSSSEIVAFYRSGLSNMDFEKQNKTEAFLQKIPVDIYVDTPLTLEHGDFDICNFFYNSEEPFVLDFEHCESGCLPFFDVSNVVFSTLITDWRGAGSGLTLKEFAGSSGWLLCIENTLEKYAVWSKTPLSLLKFLPGLAAVSMYQKKFPDSRQPSDYPLFGDDVFDQLLDWQLEFRCRI